MGNCVSCTESSSNNEQRELRVTGSRSIRNGSVDRSSFTLVSGGMLRTDLNSSSSRLEQLTNGSRISSLTSQINNPTGEMSQRIEKKNFYSRIPPIGRNGNDKKSILAHSNNSSFRDNNNAYSETKIATLFEIYKDPHEDSILAEGIEKLCRDLLCPPDDFRILILAWKFGAEQMCKFTREEFFRGMKGLSTDTLKGLQLRLPEIVQEVLLDPLQFKELYRFAFRFGLDSDIGQRTLPTEMAISLWKVVFSQKEPSILNRWIRFLEKHPHIRGIPRDTWNMFLNFVETVGIDLNSYDETEAWPSLFDDFVEFENDQLNQNISNVTMDKGGPNPKEEFSSHLNSFSKHSD